MIAYANIGNRRSMEAMRAAGWRLLLAPYRRSDLRSQQHIDDGFRYGLDNGAWSAYCAKKPFDVSAFERALAKFGAGADWVVVPDIVAAGERSLDFSLQWLERLRDFPTLLAVQDGMTARMVLPHINRRTGIFVGGTTEWKERTMPFWGALAHQENSYMHVGRVNTARRIRLCEEAGADSFDGTSVSRYAVTLPELENARQQRGFQWALS